MKVEMEFDFSQLKLKKNQAAVFIPLIVNGTDTLALPEVGVYGRNRWYKFEREKLLPLGDPDGMALRYKNDMENVQYVCDVEYQEWMNGSELIVKHIDYGCANCHTENIDTNALAEYSEYKYIFEPVFIYKEAIAETEKTRELSGSAFVDFPVNQIIIYPDYRDNTNELAKIIATIDSVKNDKEVTVNYLSIKGFASPEGPYSNNIRLAKGRTEALKTYVERLYSFPEGFIVTSYEPEDWEGLRNWVLKSDIANKEGILEIIDSDLEPDPKNSKLQTTYPVQYKYLLSNVYPALRHSDYKIEYTIRQYTDIKEIEEIFREAPQKLSISEMYALAGKYEPGSDMYNKIFETAVGIYPNDEVANLNAANAAMSKRNLDLAARYLEKAGNSAEADYARGMLNALKGNRTMAEEFFMKAGRKGLNNMGETIEYLRNSKIPNIE